MVPGLFADLLHAIRLHARRPAFALASVAMLALAIGAAAAVFSLVRGVLLRELPFAAPDRLAWMYNARTERDRAPFSIPDLDDYRRDNTTLAGLAVFTNWTANLTGAGDAERLEGTRVSGNFFALLGTRPAMGRVFDTRDETARARVTVLAHGLWTRRFGGDPAIVGRTIALNGAAHVIVGVMPAGFVFPFRDAELAVPLPWRDDPRRTDRGANFLRVVARLKPGASFAQAKADLDAIAHRLQREYPEEDARKTGVSLYRLDAEIVSDYRQLLWTLFAAVAVLVAIGCGNLANLLLVRAVGRTPELALRLSLGASPLRIVRQLSIEGAVLAGAGGALGVLVARAAIAAWPALGPANFPRLGEVEIDRQVFLFAVALSAVVALVCGVIPGWMAVGSVADSTRRATRTITGSPHEGMLRRGFVMVQIGGAAVLLVCMGLVARGFSRLERVDPGFTPDHALSVQLSLPPARYASRDTIVGLYDGLRVRFEAISGVRAVGVISLLPLSGLLSTIDIAFADRPAPPPDEVPQAHFRIASAGYFAAAGIGVIDGREFTDRDGPQARPVAIVSRALAERHWPGRRVVGQSIQVAQSPPSPMLEIVGVVRDVKQFTVDGAATADLYVPIAHRAHVLGDANRFRSASSDPGDPPRRARRRRRRRGFQHAAARRGAVGVARRPARHGAAARNLRAGGDAPRGRGRIRGRGVFRRHAPARAGDPIRVWREPAGSGEAGADRRMSGCVRGHRRRPHDRARRGAFAWRRPVFRGPVRSGHLCRRWLGARRADVRRNLAARTAGEPRRSCRAAQGVTSSRCSSAREDTHFFSVLARRRSGAAEERPRRRGHFTIP